MAYKSDLGNITALDEYLGHPHKNYRTIHVAGTNGKGSVSHLIASVLMEAGFRTGLYISPHLTDFRERITVNGKLIEKKAVTGFIDRHMGFLQTIEPSFFEMTVALAFDYFNHCKVDVAVIEVGLGGRLDSTNIITPELSVITNIGHDHMDLLGNSFEKIAFEKAGIIKPGIPVVISETQPETKYIFTEKAANSCSEIYFADENYECRFDEGTNPTGIRWFTLTDKISNISFHAKSGLAGEYQAKNIQAVVQSLRVLQATFRHSHQHIIDGILKVVDNTHLSGRWQTVGTKPLTICDTAHNREGLECVLDQISRMPRTRLRIILGFVDDKDLSLILPLFPDDAIYYFARASVPRALDERILENEALKFGLAGHSFDNVKAALRAARTDANERDLIFVGGSTFVVADLLSCQP
jgi:dihydrofolate synthase/folylpolyglutamate synthase